MPRKSAQKSMNNKLRDDGVFAGESSFLTVRTAGGKRDTLSV